MAASKKAKTSKKADDPRQVVLHASNERIHEAVSILKEKKIPVKVLKLNPKTSVLTTSQIRASEARQMLQGWASTDELVSEVYSIYFFCSSCGKLVIPWANYCRHCRAFIGDAHAM